MTVLLELEQALEVVALPLGRRVAQPASRLVRQERFDRGCHRARLDLVACSFGLGLRFGFARKRLSRADAIGSLCDDLPSASIFVGSVNIVSSFPHGVSNPSRDTTGSVADNREWSRSASAARMRASIAARSWGVSLTGAPRRIHRCMRRP